MNTARLVVLTIAVGAGGIAACVASGSDKTPLAVPVAQLPLHSIANLNSVDATSDEPSARRGDSIYVIRHSVPSQAATQK